MTFPTDRPDEDADGPRTERSTSRPPWETWEPGVRVMVRSRLPEGSSHLFTDHIGTVTGRSAGVLTLETRTGPVEIAVASIATGKTVPPAPARRRPRVV